MRKILLIALALAASAVAVLTLRANSLILDTTGKSLELETSAAVSTDYVVSYADHTSSAFTPAMNQGNVSTATTTTILAAPGASTQRQVKWVSIRNRSTTASQTVTLKLDVSATEYHVTPAVVLQAGETLRMDADGSVRVFDVAGRAKTQATELQGINGVTYDFYKVGTAAEAVGVRYAHLKDSGIPGAWVPGTPGLAGATVDGTTFGGCYGPTVNPASGSYYLAGASAATSVAHFLRVADLLWYNTGIAVTTTTAQTINSVAFPARDVSGTTNGAGVIAGIYVTTATTNGSAVTNTTMSYTDQSGNAGATGTISSFPATAVAGTLVPFQLAAGDWGVRSIQSVTLGTSYGGGAVSLVAYNVKAGLPNPVANVGSAMVQEPSWSPPGVRLYNGTCLFTYYVAGATTATNATGSLTVMER